MKKQKRIEESTVRSKIGSQLDFASREAYNLLRTNIMFAFPDREGGKIMGVCSSVPHEGKSTVSVNLSYSLAEAGHKVLLIDGDMRRPTSFKMLNIPMEPGLSDVLAGKCEFCPVEGVLHENLSALVSGHNPPNPAELIGSKKMGSLLESLRHEYDYIIIDLPPALVVSDPIAVSKYIDGIMIVVRHEAAKRRDINEMIRQFEFAGVKILGFVYNMIGKKQNKKKNGYGYGYSYGYGYGYGHSHHSSGVSSDSKSAK